MPGQLIPLSHYVMLHSQSAMKLRRGIRDILWLREQPPKKKYKNKKNQKNPTKKTHLTIKSPKTSSWGNLTAHCPKDKSYIFHFSVPPSPIRWKRISAKVHGFIHLNNSSRFKRKMGELHCQHKVEVESTSVRRQRCEQKFLLRATASCYIGCPNLWKYVWRCEGCSRKESIQTKCLPFLRHKNESTCNQPDLLYSFLTYNPLLYIKVSHY